MNVCCIDGGTTQRLYCQCISGHILRSFSWVSNTLTLYAHSSQEQNAPSRCSSKCALDRSSLFRTSAARSTQHGSILRVCLRQLHAQWAALKNAKQWWRVLLLYVLYACRQASDDIRNANVHARGRAGTVWHELIATGCSLVECYKRRKLDEHLTLWWHQTCPSNHHKAYLWFELIQVCLANNTCFM